MLNAKPTTPQIIAALAISAPFLAGSFVLVVFAAMSAVPLAFNQGAILDLDPNRDVSTGEAARLDIIQRAVGFAWRGKESEVLPASANNFWYYRNGTFNGSIVYWVFECGSKQDCLKAVERLDGPKPAAFKPWEPSRYAVVMEGVDFYARSCRWDKTLRDNPWNVRDIQDGVVYEEVIGDHRSMVYYAVDFKRNRVYHHFESGGFPADEYQPLDKRGPAVAKSR
jgi:hypothetical protein